MPAKIIKVQHGQMKHPIDHYYHHSRHCDIHGSHGPLYICPTYSRSMKNKLKKMVHNFRNACKKGKVEFICNNSNDTHQMEGHNIDDIYFKDKLNATENVSQASQDILG